MLKTIISFCSLRVLKSEFTDTVSGQRVYSYCDCYGEVWLKDSRWSLFRVSKGGE
jgi:hypothetical protein